MQMNNNPLLDGEEEDSSASWPKRIAVGLAILLVLAGVGYGIKKLMSGGEAHKKQVTTIKLLPDTPPPPPPPPPKEPPKEQPKEQPKEAPKAPEPKPAETPPAENLKMEGPAGDGPSPFQAGAVNNDYKGGDVKTIGSDGGEKYKWFAGLIKNHIQDTLEKEFEKDPKLRSAQYKLIVSVWLKPNGEPDRFEWSWIEAEDDVKQAVIKTLEKMPAMRDGLPEGMPQPVKLRISARK